MRKRGIKSKRPEAEKFFSIYDNKDLSVDEIARIYGVSKNTIYNWAVQLRKEKVSDKQIYNRVNFSKKSVKSQA